MKIYIGTDHAGFEMKELLKVYLGNLGYTIEDKGAFAFNKDDDYPDFVRPVAEAVAADLDSLGVILGASGQGEAMCANRTKGIRAMVYYGPGPKNQTDSSGNTLDMISSTRIHNNANIISLGARFLTPEEAKQAVKTFIETPFVVEDRHERRNKKLDEIR